MSTCLKLAEMDSGSEVVAPPSERLAVLEGRIECNLENCLQVARDLLEIHNDELYKPGYKDFKAYIQGRWGYTRQWGYIQLGWAEVAAKIGVNDSFTPIPTATQARHLKSLPDPAKVWDEVVSEFGPTATEQQVKEVVARYHQPKTRKAKARLEPVVIPWDEPREAAKVIRTIYQGDRLAELITALQEDQDPEETTTQDQPPAHQPEPDPDPDQPPPQDPEPDQEDPEDQEEAPEADHPQPDQPEGEVLQDWHPMQVFPARTQLVWGKVRATLITEDRWSFSQMVKVDGKTHWTGSNPVWVQRTATGWSVRIRDYSRDESDKTVATRLHLGRALSMGMRLAKKPDRNPRLVSREMIPSRQITVIKTERKSDAN